MPENLSDLRDGADTVAAQYLRDFKTLRFNPAGVQAMAIESVEAAIGGGVQLVDATSPFTALLGVSTLNTVGFLIEDEALDRRSYPSLARTQEDLYNHMSDAAYANRFASPVTEKFQVLVSVTELASRMVTDPTDPTSKIAVIPRFSTTTVLDTTFTLLYPVIVRQLPHGGFVVNYDYSNAHVLHALSTNRIESTIRANVETQAEVLLFDVDLVQVSVRTARSDVNATTGFKRQFNFTHDFCMAEVFYKNNTTNGQWVKLAVTHSEFVYDRSTPTAVLQVLPGVLNVRIPAIYLTDRTVTGSVRVDIYSTRGEISLNTTSVAPMDFVSQWTTLVVEDKTAAVAAWQGINNKYVFNNTVISGGSPALDFETLRSRVILDAVGSNSVPITPSQVRAALSKDGFSIVNHIDTLTDRLFFATRLLPKSFDEKLITPGNASMESFVSSFSQAAVHPATKVNGNRITLPPEILYEADNGVVKMVLPQTVATLIANDPERIAQLVSARDFLYTPFHYVLDANDDAFKARVYYLDGSTAEIGIFVAQNGTTGLNVMTSGFNIRRVAEGFVLTLTTKGNDAWRALDSSQVHAQLFQETGVDAGTYYQGEVIGRDDQGNVTFEFNLTSNFDIDNNHKLGLTSGKLINLNARTSWVDLKQQFGLIYSCSAAMPAEWQTSTIDEKLGNFLLPNRIAAVVLDRVIVRFGQSLDYLWSAARTITASAPYQRYENDVPMTYNENVYERVNGSTITFNSANEPVFGALLHRAGDPVFDENNQPQYLYRKGEVVKVNGQPVPLGEAAVLRQVQMFFLEGVYYFANDYSSTRYRGEMVETVVDWITDRVARLQDKLLEKTQVFFYPKTTRGFVEVFTEAGVSTAIQAAQSFSLQLTTPKQVFENEKMRTALIAATIKTIDNHLKQPTVSRSAMVSDLRETYGAEVTSFTLTGLGGPRNLEAATVVNDADRCSIRKALIALPNGELSVVEDITVDFVKPKA